MFLVQQECGAIIGQAAGGGMTSCWWIKGSGLGNSGTSAGGSRIVTEAELKEMADTLGNEYFMKDENNINNGFPILKWQVDK